MRKDSDSETILEADAQMPANKGLYSDFEWILAAWQIRTRGLGLNSHGFAWFDEPQTQVVSGSRRARLGDGV